MKAPCVSQLSLVLGLHESHCSTGPERRHPEMPSSGTVAFTPAPVPLSSARHIGGMTTLHRWGNPRPAEVKGLVPGHMAVELNRLTLDS